MVTGSFFSGQPFEGVFDHLILCSRKDCTWTYKLVQCSQFIKSHMDKHDSFLLCFNFRLAEAKNIDGKSSVHATFNGTVSWVQRKVYQTACYIDMTNYPFDRQECHIILKSSSYSLYEMELVSLYSEGSKRWHLGDLGMLKQYQEASEWHVENIELQAFRDEELGSSILTFTIVLKRKIVFFTFILLLPCIFLTMLTLVVFWLPPERPDKTTLGKLFVSMATPV